MTDSTEDDAINIDVTLTRDDFTRFVQFTTYSQLHVKILRVVAVIFLIVPIVMLLLGINLFRFADMPMYAPIAIFFPVWVFLALPIQARYLSRRKWEATPVIRETISYHLSDHGVIMQGQTWNASMQWSSILNAQYSEGMFLLGRGQNLYNIIPCRAFESDEQMARFRQMVEKNVADCRWRAAAG